VKDSGPKTVDYFFIKKKTKQETTPPKREIACGLQVSMTKKKRLESRKAGKLERKLEGKKETEH
jgi:hypothetical protein